MTKEILLYLGAGLTALWGLAHLIPTKQIVAGFGEISQDNKHIITMEWIVEGLALIFIGGVVAVATAIDVLSPVSSGVYLISAGMLVILGGVSLFTGFKVNFFMFKLCPLIFGISTALILAGYLL